MSVDEQVTADLIQTLEDGKEGFTKAADRLADSNRAQLVSQMRSFAEQRGRFSQELRNMAAVYGDRIEAKSSIAGAAHRGWMAIKDALAGDDADGVLDVAAQGEHHAVTEYDKALGEDISPELRHVVERQAAEIRAAQDIVRSMRDAA